MEDKTRRLNPFALPAETNVRFTLLLLAIVALTINAGYFLLLVFAENVLDPAAGAGNLPSVDSPTYFADVRAWAGQGLLFFIRYFLVLAVPLAGVFGVAWVLYRRHPRALLRHYGLTLLPPHQWPSFQAEVRQLAQAAGLPPPAIASTASLKGQGAQAFGFRSRPMLRLDGGWRLRQRQDPATFRAVVLHELGHWANGDVARTYFAQALWQTARWLPVAFLAVAFVAFVMKQIQHVTASTFDLTRVLTVNLPSLFLIFGQVIFLFAVIAAIRASLLRVREYYADWFAALWGAAPALQRQLARHPELFRPWWRRLFQLHPPVGERAATLAQPRRLFLVQKDVVFWAGLLFALISAGLLPFSLSMLQVLTGASLIAESFLAEAAVASDSLGLIRLVQLLITIASLLSWLLLASAILVLSYAVVGVVGVEVQREVVAGVLRPWRFWTLIALLLAAGVEIGFLAAIGGLLSPLGIILGQQQALWRILLFVPLAGALFACIWLWLFYVRVASRWLIARHKGDRPPRWTQRWLNAVSALVLWLCFMPSLLARLIVLSDFTLTETLAPVLGLILLAGVGYGGIFAGTWGWATLRQWWQRDRQGQAWLYLAWERLAEYEGN